MNDRFRRNSIRALLVVLLLAVTVVVIKHEGEEDVRPLRIVMANDVPFSPYVWVEARRDYGIQVEIDRGGDTIELSRQAASGELQDDYDAVWLANTSYAKLEDDGALGESYSVASDTLGLALRGKDLDRLGWRNKQVTWNDIAETISGGDLTFGMANPGKSNLGMQSLMSVLYKVGGLESDDLARGLVGNERPRLKSFFAGQSFLGENADDIYRELELKDDATQAILMFSSEVKKLPDEGDIKFISPTDAIGFNDFPISVLKKPSDDESEATAADKAETFADWVSQHGNELGNEAVPTTRHKLPASKPELDSALRYYREDLLRPRDVNLLVDVSISMEGELLEGAKKDIIDALEKQEGANGRAVNIRTSRTSSSVKFAQKDYSPKDPNQSRELKDFVNGMAPSEEADVYRQLSRVYLGLESSDNIVQGQSIILLTSGEAAEGVDYELWASRIRERQREQKSGSAPVLPVYIVHYGDEYREDMQSIAEETGGEVFKAKEGGLVAALDRASKYWAA